MKISLKVPQTKDFIMACLTGLYVKGKAAVIIANSLNFRVVGSAIVTIAAIKKEHLGRALNAATFIWRPAFS